MLTPEHFCPGKRGLRILGCLIVFCTLTPAQRRAQGFPYQFSVISHRRPNRLTPPSQYLPS